MVSFVTYVPTWTEKIATVVDFATRERTPISTVMPSRYKTARGIMTRLARIKVIIKILTIINQ